MAEGKDDTRRKTFTEEIEIAGSQLIERVKELLAEGRVRQLRIKTAGGEVWLETPLTVGVLGSGAVALAAPWLAILGALAALVARVRIEIVREGEAPAEKPKKKADAGKTANPRRRPVG
jgi:hypothetical protein